MRRPLPDDAVALAALLIFLVALIGFAVLVARIPTCDELGGRLVLIGYREESYVVTRVSTDQVNVPIYGRRTVPVYDCVGER